LIWNFLKYAWRETLLTINITKKYIDFKDNWKWIKKSEVQFLTEKFYQWNSEKTGDAEKRWIWVGLSLVEKIIEEHNWRIEIKSDIWQGFSFKIYF
jgi:K+-sensing histidine kinase KdpD